MEIIYNDSVIEVIRRNKGGYVRKYYPYHPQTGNITTQQASNLLFNCTK